MKTISTEVLLVLAGCDPCAEHERAIQIATPVDDGTLWFDDVIADPVRITSPPFIRIATDAAGHQVCGATMDRRFFCMRPNGVTNLDAAWIAQDVVNVGRAAVGRGEVFADGDVVWLGHPSGFGSLATCEPGFAAYLPGVGFNTHE